MSPPPSRIARAGRTSQRRVLPTLRPVLSPMRPAATAPPPRVTPKIPRTIAGLMQTVITAVNARGMCAAQAARVAELPVREVDGIAALCACQGCCRQRLM